LYLTSYLVQPIQRIPRYLLFLSDLLKRTPVSHPDFSHLQNAEKLFKEQLIFLNETKRKSENMKRLREIESSLLFQSGSDFPLATENRNLIKEGYISEMVGKVWKERYIFLFNDIIVFTSKKKEGFYFKHSSFLQSHLPVDNDLGSPTKKKTTSFVFAEFWLSTKTMKEKEDWISCLQKTINQTNKI
jgi:FYVE/RhoGEF/PH domain-containing protein 5/6